MLMDGRFLLVMLRWLCWSLVEGLFLSSPNTSDPAEWNFVLTLFLCTHFLFVDHLQNLPAGK